MYFTFDRALIAAIAFGTFSVVAGSAQANLLNNGSFELGANTGSFITLAVPPTDTTSITDWYVTSPSASTSSIDYIGSYWTAADGSRSIDLAGTSDAERNARLSQDFTAEAGKTYQVSFKLAGNPAGQPTLKTVNVGIDGNLSYFSANFNITGKTLSNMGWVLTTFLFTATNAAQTITFWNGNETNFGAAIDAVDISEVPLPPALFLFGSALVGMNWLRRRRTGQNVASATMAERS